MYKNICRAAYQRNELKQANFLLDKVPDEKLDCVLVSKLAKALRRMNLAQSRLFSQISQSEEELTLENLKHSLSTAGASK
jgi:hypothetical protein